VVEVNPEYEALAPQIVEKAETETKEHLDSVKKRAEKEAISCETIVHQGEEPYRFIVDEAKKIKADMIVMGSHGRTGIKRLMMGSVTARVIGHAPCKVLVVPC
jgi:nucleotide-binding universal stress UspA family protein